MTKNNWLLVLFTAVLAVVYAVYFTDWFKPKVVQVFHTYRDTHRPARRVGDGQLPALKFGLARKLKLTELKIFPLAESLTNQHTLPVWHLVTDSNSVPLGEFFYGQFIGGMKPAIKGTHSQTLAANVTYRLLVTAGGVTGQHDFELK